MVADGQYHIAELIAVKKNFTLRVDRGLARSIINEGSKDYLKLTTPMYLGGIPPEPGQQAFTQWHLRNLTSFNGKNSLIISYEGTCFKCTHFLNCTGCMREVWINHKQVDFKNAAQTQKVTDGCAFLDTELDDIDEDEEENDDPVVEPNPPDPCENNHCKQSSKCVPTRTGDYMCRCRPGYKGKYCEQGELESKYTVIGTNLSLLSMFTHTYL